MLQQYFTSLAQSGTVKNISEELITSKLGIIFKRIKFIDSDMELSNQGNITMVLYKEMTLLKNFKMCGGDKLKNMWKRN